MMLRTLTVSFASSFLLLMSCELLAARAAPSEFESVSQILSNRCLECHSGPDPAGNLDLTRMETAIRGGDSGTSLMAGSADRSPLFQRVSAGEMPPSKDDISKRLPDEEIEQLRKWIDGGAVWPTGTVIDRFAHTSAKRAGRDWWSLQPVERPAIPHVESLKAARGPVDSFILQKLDEHHLVPAPAATARILARRLHLDVKGLPPSFAEVEEFASDLLPDSHERMVDELLASPGYGERAARRWLDVARFAESCGYERDQIKPFIWKYRDWVIRAMNSDLPYDQFAIQQLAGDEVADRSPDTLIATGFLRLGTWNDEPNDAQEYQYDRLEDLIHATGTAFLAMTIKCARCHDHKFDPIRQEDYYRLGSAFWAGYIQPAAGDVLGGPDPKLLGGEIHGWTDRSNNPSPLHLLKKGDPKRPLTIVQPAHFSFVTSLQRPFRDSVGTESTTRRRMQFAEWIADPANPLTGRVWVNRIWQQHFGTGIVRSPDNFGFTGDAPTHPPLLDWLASELVRHQWSSKQIHRRILLSATYRQSSLHPDQEIYANVDSGNRWYWRVDRRRLDSDMLRDSLLSAAGQLDLGLRGGPSFAPTISAEALEGLSMKSNAWQASPAREQRRRSVYMLTKRSLLSPLATTFDFPDTTLPCGQRDVSIVAPQALAMLNNEFVHGQSLALAKQLMEYSTDSAQRVRQAWRAVLSREPSTDEVAIAETHLRQQHHHFQQLFEQNEQRGVRSRIVQRREFPQLVLHLAADRGVTKDESGRVQSWLDVSGDNDQAVIHADQRQPEHRPLWVSDDGSGHSVLRFDGQARYLQLSQQVLRSQQFSILAVVSDAGGDAHREIFSNWNGQSGNATTSVFLGLTGANRVRLSDDFTGGELREPSRTFILSAIAGQSECRIYQNHELLVKRPSGLAARNLTTEYAIGQQGNIQGEYWNGDIFEILVFDRGLDDREWQRIVEYLAAKYGLDPAPRPSSELLSWASLCHVLLNTNEFIYVD